jgi:hypothetical protein
MFQKGSVEGVRRVCDEDGEMLALQLTTERSTVNDSAIFSNDTKYSYEDLAEATA